MVRTNCTTIVNSFRLVKFVLIQSCIIQVASLASATLVCTLGRDQQYLLNDQLSASLAPPSWRWLATESLLLPETPCLMTYDRVLPAHYELLRGNLQKRERLGGEPMPTPCRAYGVNPGSIDFPNRSNVDQCLG